MPIRHIKSQKRHTYNIHTITYTICTSSRPTKEQVERTHRLDVAVVDGAPVADDALQILHDVIHGGAAAALLLAVVVDHGGHRQHRPHLQGVVLQQLLQNPFLLVTWCVCVCVCVCERERDRERDRERETETDRQTETDRHRERERERK